MVRPSAADPIPRWAWYALVGAGVWTLFLSALLPIVDGDVGSWSPAHAHRVFGQTMPTHRHAYDTHASTDSNCDGSGGVVCTMEDDAAFGGPLLAGSGPAALPQASVITASTLPANATPRGALATPGTRPPQL